MINIMTGAMDWFIPESARQDRADLSLARNFVFTHLVGPLLGQAVAVYLLFSNQASEFPFWVIEGCIASFWLLPFWLRYSGSLDQVAFTSSQILIFVALFGAYYYGGVSSPFLPWMLVGLLLAFFYLSRRPILIISGVLIQFGGFLTAYLVTQGFAEQLPLTALAPLSIISVSGAFIYMSWMAIFYADVITQRSELEKEADRHRATAAQLQLAMEEAQNANHSKSIFLAKMSHELRTPLNAVIGYSELLQEEVSGAGGSDEKVADLKRINMAGRHLLALVTDVLDVTRIEAETDDLRIETFEVSELVDGLLATTGALARNNGNTLDLKISPDVGSATTDPLKLRQCLMNLIGNAAKFTHNGHISVTAKRNTASSGDWLVFEVVDTGIGIAADDIDKLFRNFSQATSTTSQEFGGSGLGLMLTRRFCQMLGGEISVKSTVGKGATFTIRVPAEGPSASSSDEPSGLSHAA